LCSLKNIPCCTVTAAEQDQIDTFLKKSRYGFFCIFGSAGPRVRVCDPVTGFTTRTKDRSTHFPGTGNKKKIWDCGKATYSDGRPILCPGQGPAAARLVHISISPLEANRPAHASDRIDEKTDAAHKKKDF
jgi:hypothetical protein